TVTTAPTMTTQPVNQTVTEGSAAHFAIVATANPAPSYQWQVSIDGGATWNNVTDGTGATTASYTTPVATLAMNSYQYRCVVSNGVSPDAVSKAAILTIISKLAITVQPTNQYVVAEQQATFSVSTAGERLSYQWYINRNDGRGWLALSGSTSVSYTTLAVTLENDGFCYFCRITDAYGQTVDSDIAALHVSKTIIPPKTGDSSMPLLWLGLCLLGGLGLALIMREKQRA
ncbi:MAG: immunoglobulin domain-containing protein, partial [Eubacteriales bacterium]|nr:immunoglobulin domain-containing protein [Eubacteriales bacterium]